VVHYDALPDAALDVLFEATIQAVEEAILNALTANEAMVGRDGHFVPALPHAEVRRMVEAAQG
jgi:D-aminopeptidase